MVQLTIIPILLSGALGKEYLRNILLYEITSENLIDKNLQKYSIFLFCKNKEIVKIPESRVGNLVSIPYEEDRKESYTPPRDSSS